MKRKESVLITRARLAALSACLFGLALPRSLWAAEEAARSLVSSGLPSGYITKLGVGLLLVLCAFFAFSWVLRRVNGSQVGAAGMLKVAGGISLGSRERLVIVTVGGKQLLLGVCPGNIQMLHELDENITEPSAANPISFADRLKTAINPAGKS